MSKISERPKKVYNIEVEDNHNYFANGLLVGNSHITLAEPMPNPVFVGSRVIPGPAVALTGLKWSEFDDLVHGKTKINGKTGGAAIKDILDKVNVKEELKTTIDKLNKAKGAELNSLNRKAKYLRALDKLNMKPSDAYIINHVPVLPPIFRPITSMEDGSIASADINELYGLLIQDNNTLKRSPKELPDSEKNRYRAAIYDSLKAVAGMGSIPTYEGNKKLKGILQTIAGDSPKMGFFQSKIMKRRQELSMRSTITPASEMSMDQVGIPKDAAMDLYKPFVVRELIKSGKDTIDAQKEIKERTPLAWRALTIATQNRPVLLKRDPVLHAYNIQAFYPKLIEGNSIKIHPLVCSGFNSDFDGDTMAAYLPITEEARKEAIEKMLPSKNLFSLTNYGILHAPDQEAVMGLHYLSKWGKKVDKQYKTKDEALNDSNLHINDVITLNGKNTTKGRLLLANKLPEKFQTEDILHNPDFSLKKKWLYKTLEAIAHHDQKEYPETVNYLKDIGNKYAFEHGLTFSLKDLHPLPEQRDAVLKPFHAEAANINKNTSLSPEQKEAKIVETYTRATEEMDKQLHPMFKKMNNNIYLSAIEVGGKGSAASVRQMLEAPMLLRDANNRIVPNPVTLSYAEGLDVSGYWTALHGARKGTLQKVEGTQEPGKLTKEIVNLNINTLVTEPDCKTTKGIHLSSKEPDVIERYTAKDIHAGTTLIPAGTHVTPEIVGNLNKHGIEHVEVRSPMTCNSGNGICQKCIGHSSDGRPHEIGTNIGVIASQAIGEPAIQLALDSFHCQHAQSLVQVKIKDSELTIPMESLWDMFGVPIHTENNMEVKNLQEQEVFIWDEQWVTLNNISRHKPDSPMISVSNKELMVISQDTHPIATWGNKVKCIGCDYHRLKEPSPASKSKKPYCPKCGKYQDRIEQKMSDQLIYKEIKEIEINREYIKHSIKIPENSSNLELNPIIVGFFLAEGCIIYSGDTPNRITLSQNDGEIKDYIYNLLPVEWNAKKTAKTLIINNTKLATYFASLFPRYARNKALPPVFLSYSNEWLADFLSGLIMGDGTVKHFVDGPSQFNIDTTSFSLVQQVAFICYKLGIRCNIVTTPQRKLTRHQGYKISLRMTEHAKSLLANCLKTKNLSQSISPEQQIDLEGFRLLSNKKEVLYTHEYVYDVCTSTGSFYASGIKVHNSGGVAASRGGASVDRIKRLGQLLNIPKELPGAAILAEKAGKITSIEKDPATNGHYIHIGDHKHYAQASKELAVKVGDEVSKGDILTHGPINPHHLLPLKGIEAVRKYVADELADVVSKEGVRKRNIEVITKNLTGLAQVRDAGNSHWLVGDTVPVVELEKHNKQVQHPDNKIIYKHIVKGATGAAPFKSEDFLDQINFNRIQQHLLTAAHTLGGTKLHGLSPIPNIAQSTISTNNKPNY